MGRKRSDDAAYTFELVDDDADSVAAPQALAPAAVRDALPEGAAPDDVVPPASTTPAAPPVERAGQAEPGRDGGVLTFDLVFDADGEGEVVAGAPAPEGPGSARATRWGTLTEPVRLAARDLGSWAGRNRRVVVPVAAAVAVAALVGGGIGAAQERSRVERLAAAAGGVVSLLEAPEQVWELDETRTAAAVLDGALVLQGYDELVAVEPGTGEVRWRTELQYAECGSSQAWGVFGEVLLPEVDELLCLAGRSDERELVVVGPDGDITSRAPLGAVDPDTESDSRFGPGGGPEPQLWQEHGVVRAQRVGPDLEPVDVELDCDTTGTGACTVQPGTALEGRDLVVSLTGPTGEQVWEVTIPFELSDDPGIADSSCFSYFSSDEAEYSPDGFWVSPVAESVQVQGCGVNGLITADGALQQGAPGLSSHVVPLPGGEMADVAVDQTDVDGPVSVTSTVRSPDGTVLAEVDGFPLVPAASDSAAREVTLTGGGDGSDVRAFGPGWEELWSSPVQVWQVLAQAGGVAVVHGQQEALTALDLETGEDLWRWVAPREVDHPDGSTRYLGEPYVSSVFTDGRVLMVVNSLDAGGTGGLGVVAHGLDLRTGDLLWSQVYPDLRELRAVGGRLVGVETLGLVGLG